MPEIIAKSYQDVDKKEWINGLVTSAIIIAENLTQAPDELFDSAKTKAMIGADKVFKIIQEDEMNFGEGAVMVGFLLSSLALQAAKFLNEKHAESITTTDPEEMPPEEQFVK